MPKKKVASYNKGMTVEYSEGSSVLIRKDGTIAWRNNNPGNVVCSPFAKRHGSIGCNKNKAIFPDMATGEKAKISLLKTKNYQNKTIAGAIKKYAPPESNPTEKYIQYVTKKTGMSRDKNMSSMAPQEFDKFVGAIGRFEKLASGTEVTYSTSQSAPGGGASNRTLKRVGDIVYRIENGKTVGSFICDGKK